MDEKDIFKLEKSLQETRNIPLAEIKQVIEINKRLDALTRKDEELRRPFLPKPEFEKYIARFRQRAKTVGYGEPRRLLRIEVEKEFYGDLDGVTQGIIDQAIEYLDSLDIWKYKFKTGNPLQRPNVPPFPEEQDSLYYVTGSGLSLRLKMARIRDGFSKVRQPVLEKIFFRNERDYQIGHTIYDDVPHIGWYVEETSSDRFNELLQRDDLHSDFMSDVKLTEEDGKKAISYGDITHQGHAVKEIVQTKAQEKGGGKENKIEQKAEFNELENNIIGQGMKYWEEYKQEMESEIQNDPDSKYLDEKEVLELKALLASYFWTYKLPLKVRKAGKSLGIAPEKIEELIEEIKKGKDEN